MAEPTEQIPLNTRYNNLKSKIGKTTTEELVAKYDRRRNTNTAYNLGLIERYEKMDKDTGLIIMACIWFPIIVAGIGGAIAYKFAGIEVLPYFLAVLFIIYAAIVMIYLPKKTAIFKEYCQKRVFVYELVPMLEKWAELFPVGGEPAAQIASKAITKQKLEVERIAVLWQIASMMYGPELKRVQKVEKEMARVAIFFEL